MSTSAIALALWFEYGVGVANIKHVWLERTI